jgi:hypothetical protein
VEEGWYLRVGAVLGWIVAVPTFIGAYIYCIVHYGFLLGLGLGWLPSAILAFFVWIAVMLLWGVVAVGLVLLIYFIIKQS